MKSRTLFLLIYLLILVGCSSLQERETPAAIERKEHIVYNKKSTMHVVTIQPNDSLKQIAHQHRADIEAVAKHNGLNANYVAKKEHNIYIPIQNNHSEGEQNRYGSAQELEYNSGEMQDYATSHEPPTLDENIQVRRQEVVEEPRNFANYASEGANTEDLLSEMHIANTKQSPEPYDAKKQQIHEVTNDADNTLNAKNIKNIHQKQPYSVDKTKKNFRELDSITDLREENAAKSTANSHGGFGYSFLTMTPLNSPNFIWPVKGKVIKRYNKQSSGNSEPHEGISISAPIHTNVLAASNGKVVYSGISDKYGNLAIIKHDNEYYTAYAHNEMLLVNSGDVVRKGSLIAKVGKTGKVDMPQLYFSVRRGKTTVNPEKNH
jgi:murein DD-endopeptidase MepM/ murein hydrolase activator NlpD